MICFPGPIYSFYHLKNSVRNCIQCAKVVFYFGGYSRCCTDLRCTWKGNSNIDFKLSRTYNLIQCVIPKAIHLQNLAMFDILNSQQTLQEPCRVALDSILSLLTLHNFSEKLGTSSVFKNDNNMSFALFGW